MEILDFAEQQGQKAAAFSLATLEFNRQRCHALLMLLLGGAGALGGLAVGQSRPGPLVAIAGAVALWWFGAAAWLALRGLRSGVVRSWASEGWTLMEHSRKLEEYVKQARREGDDDVADHFTLLREMELRIAMKSGEEYRAASTAAAVALDRAYMLAAATPAVALVVWAAYAVLGKGL